MRSELELLELVLKEVESREDPFIATITETGFKFPTGLCSFIYNARVTHLFSFDEYLCLVNIISNYAKDDGFSWLDYFFPPGEKEPRIQWLKDQIQKRKLPENS